MKPKDDIDEKRERERDRDRDADRERDRERRDTGRDRERDRERDRDRRDSSNYHILHFHIQAKMPTDTLSVRSRRPGGDHWEPEERRNGEVSAMAVTWSHSSHKHSSSTSNYNFSSV